MKRSIVVGATALSLAFSAGIAIAACGGTTSNGGGSSGSGSANGTVSGITLNVADAVAISESGTPGVDATSIVVELFDIGGVCSLAASIPRNADKASFTALALLLGVQSNGASTPPVTTGTYSVGPITIGPSDGGAQVAMSAFAELTKNDAQCNKLISSTAGEATGGTVTVTSISAAGIAGSYNVTFAGGTMQGSFNAAFCTLPDAGTTATPDGGKTCVQ